METKSKTFFELLGETFKGMFKLIGALIFLLLKGLILLIEFINSLLRPLIK